MLLAGVVVLPRTRLRARLKMELLRRSSGLNSGLGRLRRRRVVVAGGLGGFGGSSSNMAAMIVFSIASSDSSSSELQSTKLSGNILYVADDKTKQFNT